MRKITSLFLALVLCLGLATGAAFAAVDAPVFDPEAGEVADGTVINITATTGAAIYYTTDGTDPEVYTSGGAIYVSGSAVQFTSASAITVNSDMTVKAIAVVTSGAGIEVSDIATAEYTVESSGGGGGGGGGKSTPTEAGDNFPFKDVPENAYFRKAVEWAWKNGITAGTSATTFSPYMSATRGQMMTYLWAAAGCPEPTTTDNPFTDVAAGAYYYKPVLWAVEKGITAGTSATTFSPDQAVTRGQAITFLYGAVGRPAGGSEPFTDVNDGDYFAPAVAWAYSNGITVGTSDTLFSPAEICQRCQIVQFLYLHYAK